MNSPSIGRSIKQTSLQFISLSASEYQSSLIYDFEMKRIDSSLYVNF